MLCARRCCLTRLTVWHAMRPSPTHSNAKLRQSREENAHLRAENSKLRIRYHTRPGVTGDFDLTPPPPPSPLARRASGRRPSGKPELVTDGSHPLGHRPASGQMFLPDDWDSDTAGAATRTAGGGQPRRGGAGGAAAAGGGGQAQQEAQSAAALFSPMHGAGGAAANTPRSQGLDPTWGSSSASYLRTAGSAATRRVANGQGMKLPRRASDVAALFGSPGGTSPASSAKAPSGLFAGLGDVSATRAGRSHSTVRGDGAGRGAWQRGQRGSCAGVSLHRLQHREAPTQSCSRPSWPRQMRGS